MNKIYQNPILKAFHPDPSICKVGDDFYIACSSFSYFPGIPIYRSRDLINWEHVADAISNPDYLPYELATASGGVWAPTIRYYDGKFYITATFSERGNFIVTSENLSEGFSEPIWVEMDGIDPSLYFEKGEAYYCANDCGRRMEKYGTEGISVARIDVNSGKLLEDPVRVWQGTGGGFLESPHIYKIENYYYLMVAEGGTSLNHMITIARAENIYGPYESCPNNPILTNRADTSKQILCSGHGDLVFDNAGNCWMVHLATRPSNGFWSHLGRETFLVPVSWEDGWPIIANGRTFLEMEGPLLEEEKVISQTEWLFLRTRAVNNVVADGDTLRITASVDSLTDPLGSPAMVLKRQTDFEDVLTAELSELSLQDGDFAGLVVYLSNDYFYKFGIICEDNQKCIVVEKVADDFHQVAIKQVFEGKVGKLKLEAHKDRYEFYLENRLLCQASSRFLCCELAGKCFTGTMWGYIVESTAVAKSQELKSSSTCTFRQ